MRIKTKIIRLPQIKVTRLIIEIGDNHLICAQRNKSHLGDLYLITSVAEGIGKRGITTSNALKAKQYIRTLIKRYSGIH